MNLLTVLVFFWWISVPPLTAQTVSLTSRISVTTSIIGNYSCSGAFGCVVFGDTFQIVVPANGTTMQVSVERTTGNRLRVYGASERIPALSGGSVSSDFNVFDNLSLTRESGLRTGTYYLRAAIMIGITSPFGQSYNEAGRLTVTIYAGTVPIGGLTFQPIVPCRIMETRPEYNFQGRTGALGPPFLNTGETRTVNLLQSNVCSIPTSAKAVVLNATLVPRGGVDFVTIWPGGDSRPDVWTVRSPDGQIVANSAIVKATNGVIQVYSSNATDLLLDISGYFTDDVQASNQVFYPLTPCRVIDTRIQYRSPAGPFGPPMMNAGETRRFRFPSTPYCSVPTGASAYSVTITAVPPGALQFLTAWPTGSSQPNVSNINSPSGRVLANSAILPASPDGSIDVFAFNQTDFLIDVNGYFAPENGSGLYYFPVVQCRASDSRNANGALAGPTYQGGVARTLPIPSSSCTGLPSNAKAYTLNVTSLPNGTPMPFITAWPTGQPQPNASILNAFQGQVVTNSAIVPAGTNGSVDVYAFTRTDVVVEVSGYFGR